MNRKILIVGGGGFIGRYISEELIQNNIDVYVTYRKEEKNKVKGVIYINISDLEALFKNDAIETVINLATDYGRVNELSKVVETNIQLPIKLAEFCVKYNVKKFITTDSFFSRYGSDYSYLENYVKTKSVCSILLQRFKNEIVVVNMNLSHVYGANDGANKFFPSLLKSLVSHNDNLDFTKGEQIRDFIYVKDVAKSYLQVLNSQFSVGFYNIDICSDERLSIKEFVEESYRLLKNYGDLVECEKKLNFGAIEYRKGEIMNVKMDSFFIRSLGWSPEYSLKAGLYESIKNEFEN